MHPIKAIPTIYKGIRFKSRLEAAFAAFLDSMNIKWQYEPQSYVVNSYIAIGGKVGAARRMIHYLPDFQLPELKIFVETKASNMAGIFWEDIGLPFFEDTLQKQNNVMIVSHTAAFLIDTLWASDETLHQFATNIGECPADEIWLGMCPECDKWNILSNEGDHSCRACGCYEGDKGHWPSHRSFIDEWTAWQQQMKERSA